MGRWIIFTVVTLLVIGGIAFIGYNLLFPQSNPITRIAASAESTANEFITELRMKKPDAAYARLSDRLKANYSEAYWKTNFFPRFADYKGEVKLVTNKPLQANATEPFAYDDASEPHKLTYDFQFEGLTYRVDMVVMKKSGQWLINELEGAYLPQA